LIKGWIEQIEAIHQVAALQHVRMVIAQLTPLTRFLKSWTTRRLEDFNGGYTNAVPMTFGNRVDFAQLIKNYEKEQETIRYSPPKIRSIEKVARFGNPDLSMVSTSFIENWNLQLRMSSR
jgi:hypothetical protein